MFKKNVGCDLSGLTFSLVVRCCHLRCFASLALPRVVLVIVCSPFVSVLVGAMTNFDSFGQRLLGTVLRSVSLVWYGSNSSSGINGCAGCTIVGVLVYELLFCSAVLV